MRIGIDLIELFPKNNQGINVYTENLVKGLLGLNEKITFQIYVNKDYYNYAKKIFISKKVKIILYNQKKNKIKNFILKLIVIFNLIFLKKLEIIYYSAKNFFFKEFKLIVEKNSDILICPNVILNHYNLNLKTLLCIHDIQHEYLPENFTKFQLIDRKITRGLSVVNCDKLITSSKTLKKQCHKYLKKNKNDIKIIEEGVDLNLFKKKIYKNRLVNNFLLPKKYLFYPAGFWPHKNHLLLLKAIKKLKKSNVNLILCGLKKNFFKEIKNFIEFNNLKNVKYLGSLSDNNLIKVYKYSTAIVIPSLEESSCLLLNEGIGFKKPILCSNTETFKEKSKVFKILFFKKNNVKDLESKIKEVYFDKILKKKELKKNYENLKIYNWKNVAKKYLDLCNKIN